MARVIKLGIKRRATQPLLPDPEPSPVKYTLIPGGQVENTSCPILCRYVNSTLYADYPHVSFVDDRYW